MIATRTNPALWERSKKAACTRAGLCKHSARKMQWAVAEYKRRGGTYAAPKSKRNSLARWTRQKWRTSSGKPSEGTRRYLPAEAWKHLTASEKRRTNAAKRAGFRRGRQWVRQPVAIAQKTSRFRS